MKRFLYMVGSGIFIGLLFLTGTLLSDRAFLNASVIYIGYSDELTFGEQNDIIMQFSSYGSVSEAKQNKRAFLASLTEKFGVEQVRFIDAFHSDNMQIPAGNYATILIGTEPYSYQTIFYNDPAWEKSQSQYCLSGSIFALKIRCFGLSLLGKIQKLV